MKTLRILMIMFLAVAAVSCNKDDDGPEPFQYNAETLKGTYNLTFFQTIEVATEDVSGFDVVTTTTSTGDTFDFTAIFAANNTVTTNGTYRVSETAVQGDQTTNNAYIEVVNNEVSGYSVISANNTLTIDGQAFIVSNYSQNGFTITANETTNFPNGDTTVTSVELRFVR